MEIRLEKKTIRQTSSYWSYDPDTEQVLYHMFMGGVFMTHPSIYTLQRLQELGYGLVEESTIDEGF